MRDEGAGIVEHTGLECVGSQLMNCTCLSERRGGIQRESEWDQLTATAITCSVLFPLLLPLLLRVLVTLLLSLES